MSMSCYGKWKNSQMCEMCLRIDDKVGSQCKKETQEKNALANKLYTIKKKCKYRDIAYDEYNPFDSCNKIGNGVW